MKPLYKIAKINDYTSTENLTENERSQFLDLKNEKRKREWLAARLNAKNLIADFFNVSEKEVEISNDKDRKPFASVAEKTFRISISHRQDLCACAFNSDLSPFIGIDIERIEPKELSHFEEFLTEKEMQACLNGEIDFSQIWAFKEAFLKMAGKGLSVSAKALCVAENKFLLSKNLTEELDFLKGKKIFHLSSPKGEYFTALVWALKEA